MKIFIFGEPSWNDTNSFGNTISNWFNGEEWNKDEFINFFARYQMPDNKLNVTYYRLTAIDIVKGILRWKITGKEFSSNDIDKIKATDATNALNEKNGIDKIHTKKVGGIYFIYDLLWMSRIWINKQLKAFIQNNKPDVFFAFAYSPASLWPMISYLKKNTNCKVVLWISDDVKASYLKQSLLRRLYLLSMLKKSLLSADKVVAASNEMAELYSSDFKIKIEPLYKGCSLDNPPKNKVNSPLRFVYAGNLLWGRDDILSKVALALHNVNADETKGFLEVYTNTTITSEIEKKINIDGSSTILGSRSYDEIKEILHDADIVLHVESFEKQNIDCVRCSFSTKIIDCLQSGSVPLAIGPSGISSIEYIKKIPGAYVADSEDEIENVINKIITSKSQLVMSMNHVREYAFKNHEIRTVQKKLRNDFVELLSE